MRRATMTLGWKRSFTTAKMTQVLERAMAKKVFDEDDLEASPVALFYDLDSYDGLLKECQAAFPSHFRHFVAAKANPLPAMLTRSLNRGFGIECASIGELLMAMRELGTKNVVFDSPAKTMKELRFAMSRNLRCHLDNFDEFDRAVDIQRTLDGPVSLGFRVNPSTAVDTDAIAALNVSTPDSKFGVDLGIHWDDVVQRYVETPFLDSIHVHVGSGFHAGSTPEHQLSAGVRAAVDVALEVNSRVPNRIRFIDIGGGLPVNYADDQRRVTFQSYADVLQRKCPELFDPSIFANVLTEFGQSLNAKAGFLASRIEFVKKEPSRTSSLAIVHFGADVCVRQAYGGRDHPRRFAAFHGKTAAPLTGPQIQWSVGGPLCFQGDFVAKDIALPSDLASGDFLVMKDAGANTLSLFSRHCSRFAPPVYGVSGNTMIQLKPREDLNTLATFWTGRADPADRREFLDNIDDIDDDDIPAVAASGRF